MPSLPSFRCEDIIERVEESKVLSKLDLAKGFYQVVMEDKSIELTTLYPPMGNINLDVCLSA